MLISASQHQLEITIVEMASEQTGSTQNTQYDKIGKKYNNIKVLAATEPEEPSIVKVLGDIKGARCLGTSTTNSKPRRPPTFLPY